jgi:hypothetical protein
MNGELVLVPCQHFGTRFKQVGCGDRILLDSGCGVD